jgi:hypothetical protein
MNYSNNDSKKTSKSQEKNPPDFSEIFKLGVDCKLSPPERLFLLAIRNPMNKHNKKCWEGRKRLSIETGLSRKTIQRCINSLRDKKIISVSKKRITPEGLPNNCYQFTLHRARESIGSQSPYARGHSVPMDRVTESLCIGSQSPLNQATQSGKQISQSSVTATDDRSGKLPTENSLTETESISIAKEKKKIVDPEESKIRAEVDTFLEDMGECHKEYTLDYAERQLNLYANGPVSNRQAYRYKIIYNNCIKGEDPGYDQPDTPEERRKEAARMGV